MKKFKIFWFSPNAREPPKIFNVQFFQFFEKQTPKLAFWDLANMGRNKVRKFGGKIGLKNITIDEFYLVDLWYSSTLEVFDQVHSRRLISFLGHIYVFEFSLIVLLFLDDFGVREELLSLHPHSIYIGKVVNIHRYLSSWNLCKGNMMKH